MSGSSSGQLTLGRAAIPVAFFLERGAYYGMRSGLTLYLTSTLALTSSDVMATYTRLTVFTTLMPFLGAAVGAALGARLTYPIGACIAALGYVVLGAVTYAGAPLPAIYLALAIIGVGSGLFRPNALAAVGELSEPGKDLTRAGVMAFVYAAINVGAMLAAPVAGLLQSGLGLFWPGCFLAAVMAIFAAVAGGGAAMITRAHPPPPRHDRDALPEVGVALLLGLDLLFWLVGSAISSATYRTSGLDFQFLYSLNPAIVLLVCVVLGAVCLGLGSGRVRIPFLPVMGAGLLLSAVGVAMLAVGGGEPPLVIVLAAIGVSSLGEALWAPVLMARIAAGMHWRLLPVAFAAFPLVAWLASWSADKMAEDGAALSPAIAITLGVLSILVALPMLIFGAKVERSLFGEAPAPPSSAPFAP